MKEPEVITVAMAEKDQYGNLKVTDNLGKEYKIGEKRAHLFELFVEGRAVKITWDNYLNKDYISDAVLFDGKPPEGKQTEHITAGVDKPKMPAPQELGMWWKELGNRIGDGSLAKDYPKSQVKIKTQYYRKMSEITGVSFKEE